MLKNYESIKNHEHTFEHERKSLSCVHLSLQQSTHRESHVLIPGVDENATKVVVFGHDTSAEVVAEVLVAASHGSGAPEIVAACAEFDADASKKVAEVDEEEDLELPSREFNIEAYESVVDATLSRTKSTEAMFNSSVNANLTVTVMPDWIPTTDKYTLNDVLLATSQPATITFTAFLK